MPAKTDKLAFERDLLLQGVTPVAGVDEVGRGPLAGPVVAAAVVLPDEWVRAGMPADLAGINDSKQLSAAQREHFDALLRAQPGVRFALASVEAGEIDTLNIARATHQAMNLALAQLAPPPCHVLVDGLPVRSIRMKQTAIVKGDSLSYSIAAASILAKVARDRTMQEFDRLYPQYEFAAHKGYGTERHLAAIARHGPCPIHRKSFAPLRAPQPELFPA